jgi:histidinol dehydrogenase
MEYKEIDFSKVNDRITEQAYDSAFHMTEEQTRKLIQSKFDRAKAYYRAQQASPDWYTDR